jgi:hypothetical protein
MHPNGHRLGRALLALTAVALLAAGCGGDDDEGSVPTSGNTPTTPSTEAVADPAAADTTAYCTAEAARESAPVADTSEAASDEEVATILRTWATETQPLVAAVVAAAPEEVAADVQTLSGAIDGLATSGDPNALTAPEVLTATEAVHTYDLENCDWASLVVVATDYAYGGITPEVAAGVTSFELENQGSEPHELRIFRRADGVTTGAEQLLALPEDQLAAQAPEVGGGTYATPGGSSHFVADLQAGSYFAACFVPVGSNDQSTPPAADAPHHFDEGMVVEFTVA